jgi:hypothetical protein
MGAGKDTERIVTESQQVLNLLDNVIAELKHQIERTGIVRNLLTENTEAGEAKCDSSKEQPQNFIYLLNMKVGQLRACNEQLANINNDLNRVV